MVGLGRTVEPPIIGRITAALRYAAYRWVVTAHVTGREVAARRLRVVVLLIDIQDKFSGMYACSCSTYKLTIIEVARLSLLKLCLVLCMETSVDS